MTQPTTRQTEILDFMRQHVDETGVPPTVREICNEFGIRSPNGVACHLLALVKKGLLQEGEAGASRRWMPVRQQTGFPLLTWEQLRRIDQP